MEILFCTEFELSLSYYLRHPLIYAHFVVDIFTLSLSQELESVVV